MVSVTTAAGEVRRGRAARWHVGRINGTGIGFLVALIVVWQLVMSVGLLQSEFLPTPLAVIRATGGLAGSGALTTTFGHTLYVTMIGWIATVVLGIGLGLILGLSQTVWRYSMASIEFLRALPAIALVPVSVLLFGFSIKMELAVVIYVSVWPLLIGTIHGARQVTPLHRDIAKMLQMSWSARVRRIVLPTTAPFIFVGMQLALWLGLGMALVAEMVGAPVGVGQALIVAQNTLHPADMFAYVVLIGIVGVVLNWGLVKLCEVVFPGTSSAGGARE